MATSRIFDSIVRHRIDLQRYTRREASVLLGIMAGEDAKLVGLLRERLPRIVTPGQVDELMHSVRGMRAASFGKVRDVLAGDLVELGKVEGTVATRLAQTAIGVPVPFNPVREQAIRASLSQPMFGAGRDGKTLAGWFDGLKAADQGRLTEAVQLGIRRQETVDAQVRRIAGTRANDYADGLLAIPRRAAESAVRTGVVHIANVAQKEWGKANADVVIGFERVEMLDERTCEECAAPDMAGAFIPNGDREPPAGMELARHGELEHPNCRFTTVPVFDLDALADKMPDEGEAREAA